MSQREGLDLKAHKRLPNGKFDLNQWNSTYWNRFSNCLKWCNEKNIIIQIEVWDRFNYSQEHWQESPWRPYNNINYTSAKLKQALDNPRTYTFIDISQVNSRTFNEDHSNNVKWIAEQAIGEIGLPSPAEKQ